jgi:hypothetical protein
MAKMLILQRLRKTYVVIDDEWLAKPVGQPLSHQAREHVESTAGGGGHDDAR